MWCYTKQRKRNFDGSEEPDTSLVAVLYDDGWYSRTNAPGQDISKYLGPFETAEEAMQMAQHPHFDLLVSLRRGNKKT